MSWSTADLCDAHPHVQVAEPVFTDFGGRSRFGGPVATVRVFEDNVLVRQALSERGEGRVLVVDGGGSLAVALVGDRLAALGAGNGWAGIVVNGCVRDTAELQRIDVGVRALAACPRRSAKAGVGTRGELVVFAGVTFRPGEWLYADADGIVVSPKSIH